MSRRPSFQFYPGDWLRDSVSGCSLEAQGLWLRMIFLMHDSERCGYLAVNGSPIPPESIARRCGCTPEQYETLLAELERAGVPSRTSNGVIYSRRMVRDARERAEAADRKRKSRAKEEQEGTEEECPPDVTPMSQLSSSSSSSSEKKKKDKKEKEFTEEGFLEFWEAYPKKQAKAAAEKAWRKLRLGEELRAAIMTSLVQQRGSPQWTKDGGAYIPLPASWLNGRRWEDEVAEVKPEDPWKKYA